MFFIILPFIEIVSMLFLCVLIMTACFSGRARKALGNAILFFIPTKKLREKVKDKIREAAYRLDKQYRLKYKVIFLDNGCTVYSHDINFKDLFIEGKRLFTAGLKIGPSKIGAEKLKKAVSYFTASIEDFQNRAPETKFSKTLYGEPYLYRGFIYYHMGLKTEAIADLTKVIEKLVLSQGSIPVDVTLPEG